MTFIGERTNTQKRLIGGTTKDEIQIAITPNARMKLGEHHREVKVYVHPSQEATCVTLPVAFFFTKPIMKI
eukprot:m.239147 g.239147  ORF g.239147 m.239147 type:complete len:71 (+) comp13936_c0_seq10:991-1203(+)